MLILDVILSAISLVCLVVALRRLKMVRALATGLPLYIEYKLGKMEERQKTQLLCIQYALTCLRPYIMCLLNKAVAREDYREAEECKKLVAEIDKLIRYNSNTESK